MLCDLPAHKCQFPTKELLNKMNQNLITYSISSTLIVCNYCCFHQAKEVAVRGQMLSMPTPLDHINLHIRGGYILPWQKSENNTYYRWVHTHHGWHIMTAHSYRSASCVFSVKCVCFLSVCASVSVQRDDRVTGGATCVLVFLLCLNGSKTSFT